jgi:double-stranded uracil-DNA glycosylase
VSAVLPDVLRPGLRVIFCGTAVGKKSAQVGAYYAGPGNQFWPTLFRTGLTPRQLTPHEFATVVEYGIGLTDIAKSVSGADKILRPGHFSADGLRAKIAEYAPLALAFNGKRSAQEFYGHPVMYGKQAEGIGETAVFVLPSTSGAARGFWDESYWRGLASFVK